MHLFDDLVGAGEKRGRRSTLNAFALRRFITSSNLKRDACHFPLTFRVMGTLSIRLRDFTISLVSSAYFLKCGVSRCALNASAFSYTSNNLTWVGFSLSKTALKLLQPGSIRTAVSPFSLIAALNLSS